MMRMPNLLWRLGLVGAFGMCVLTARGYGASTPSRDEVEEAVQFGRSSAVEPYPLYGLGRGRVIAHLYTPFIRIAMFARSQTDAGRPVSAADVPTELLRDESVHVAVLTVPDVVSAESHAAALNNAPIQVVLWPSDRPFAVKAVGKTGGVVPLWTRRVADGPLPSLSAAQDSEYEAIAAFKRSDIRAGLSLVVYRAVFDGPHTDLQRNESAVTDQTIATWR